MRTAHRTGLALLALLLAPVATLAQAQNGAATPIDFLFRSLMGQAHIRFEQAGVEPTDVSWKLLEGMVDHGVTRIKQDNPTAVRVALARRNLNSFVDDMIHAAVYEDGAYVAHESSFAEALRRCRPPKYPYCP